ncbi:hypothetical protein [Pleionea sp. CnH1-48]|uniref:hypothetical protein n=1 Tax=Pleionea sp. CnH1-48 TaxID=2954494 RepID=UPI002096B58B|nr:hypothetical protein [Pleionea sp. CnH1-48]MCO7223923.1 hypothetical protein [Pleionea sp. CnH1-48]
MIKGYLVGGLTLVVVTGYFLLKTENKKVKVKSESDEPKIINIAQKLASDSSPPFDMTSLSTSPGEEFARCKSLFYSLSSTFRDIQDFNITLPEEISSQYSSDEIVVALQSLGLDARPYANKILDARFDYEEFDKGLMSSNVSNTEAYLKDFLVADENTKLQMLEERPIYAQNITSLLGDQKRNLESLAYIEKNKDKIEKEYYQMVKSAYFSNQEIKELIRYIRNIDAPTSSLSQRLSLVEVAAIFGNVEIFEFLLKQDAKIESTYLEPNILERVIKYGKLEESPESFKLILQTLMNYSLPFRVKEGSQYDPHRLYIGSGNREFFDELSNEKKELLASVGIDFESRVNDESYRDLAEPALIEKIITLSNEHLYSKSGSSKAEADDCVAFVKQIFRNLLKHDLLQVIRDADSMYSDRKDRLEYLNSLEPGLVDAYRIIEENLPPSSGNIVISHEEIILATLLEKEKYQEVEDFIEKHQFKDLEMESLFWKVAGKQGVDLKILLDNQFITADDNYSKAGRVTPEQLKTLINYGLPFNNMDKREKTLVYYAAGYCNIELLSYLNRQEYAYHKSQVGDDPLGETIRRLGLSSPPCSRVRVNGKDYSPNKNLRTPENLVAELMKFHPKINQHHLKKMAELKVLNIDTYNKIVEKVPELTVSDDVPFSGYFIGLDQVFWGFIIKL